MAFETTYASRNIGDIFFTLRKDAILNGAVEANGTEYNAFEFSLLDEMSNPYTLCVNDKLPAVDYATYALEIKQHGCCASFGIDPANGRFKVPTLRDVHIKAGDLDSLAKYMSGHVPNLKGITPVGYGTGVSGSTGPFYDTDIACNNLEIATVDRSKALGFDASKVSSVYQDDVEDVEVDSLILRPMVQLVTVAAGSGDTSGGGSSSGGGVVSGFPLPYTFVPGTEARALEVNANFDQVRSYLTSIEEDVEKKQYSEDAELTTTNKNITKAINELDEEVSTKAENSLVLHKAGAESITGTKTFEGVPLIFKNCSRHSVRLYAPSSQASTVTGPEITAVSAYEGNGVFLGTLGFNSADWQDMYHSGYTQATFILNKPGGSGSAVDTATLLRMSCKDPDTDCFVEVPTISNLNDVSDKVVTTKFLSQYWAAKTPTLDNLAYLSFPNYASGVAIGSGYVAPTPGWVKWRHNQENDAQLWINGVEVGVRTHYKYGSSSAHLFPISKGETVTFSNTLSAVFFRAK